MREEGGEFPPLTPEQTAAACAALHDAHCHGVEKVIPLHDDDERPVTAESLAWAATVGALWALGDHALRWYTAQFARFEEILAPPGDADPQTIWSL